MSKWTHCDGPNCGDQRQDHEYNVRRPDGLSWFTVSDNFEGYDFCSPRCMSMWADEKHAARRQ